jgi:hypothetical protein
VSKGELKETRVEIRLPKSGYPKTMFFNRFRVEREEEFCLVHFGLVSAAGLLLDHFSSVFPRQTLEHNQESLLDYLERLGQPKQKAPPAWQGALPGQGADVVDIVSMAFRNNMAETCLCIFSLTAATRLKPGGSDVLEAQPLVLLRSSLEMQQQLLVALYEE